MFIIGILDTVRRSVEKAVKSSSKGIITINRQIRLPIIKDIRVNTDLLGNINEGLVSNTLKLLKGNKEALDTISKMSMNLVNFSDIQNPLEKALASMVNLTENKLSGQIGKFLKLEVFDYINEYNEMRKDDHITSFEGFMKFSNDIWSIMAGIKPFNIMFGKESWLDESKRGIYYDITRGFIMGYIFFSWGNSAMMSFFNKMSEQKIKEHYAFEKLSIHEYQKLDFRGLLNENELKDMAYFLGFDERAMELVNITAKFYPSVRDSIDFAVREAFEPDESLFIHGGNAIPKPFSEIAEKLGIDEIWVKRFWHSHWRLLGAGQLLEAFHRKFITEPELLDYLRRLDYVEKDRELIMDMSYNLLTRVDIRRIFEQGLISSMDLYEYYGKLGFTERDQGLMTGLAKQMRFIDTNDLRKIYIERYENGLISENQIKELLHNTGLDLDEINGYLQLSDEQKELEFLIELKKRIETKFYEGDIDFDDLVQQLRQLGVSNRELKRIEKNAILFDFRKKKLPTLAELKRYYKKNIIDLNKFVYYALRLGLEKEHIFWILSDMSE